jgi:amidohydrolase
MRRRMIVIMKKEILEHVEAIKEEIFQLSSYIYDNPQLGHQEVLACDAHVKLLEKHGFEVEVGVLGFKTAFKAQYKSPKEGPVIAYFAEYDALPGIGHGCGHNALGAVSSGAAIALKGMLNDIGGTVIVFGTPAEETDGAKVDMAKSGFIDGVDAALMAHPADVYQKSGTSLAMEAIEFAFEGKSSHAAAEPHKGINALDAVMLTFAGVNALRQHVTSDVRMHGIVHEGGEAANIVPSRAVARFYVRSAKKAYLKELIEKVKNCARGAALMTGAKVQISNYEASYDDMNTNEVLSEAFNKSLREYGVEDIKDERESTGSIDMGNVSYVAPAIHPYFSISGEGIVAHTKEFAQATLTPKAKEEMVRTMAALALTGAQVITDKDLLSSIKKEFNKIKGI